MRARDWLLAFALGSAAGLMGLAANRPPWLFAGWCRLRHGGEASPEGLVLRVSEAPPEARGEGPGPWLLVELINEGRGPLTLHLCRPPGEELEVTGTGPDGAPLERPPFDPARPTLARPISRVDLRPGERIAQTLDLRERLEPRGPGRYAIRVRRLGFPGLDPLAAAGEVELLQR